MHGVFKLLHGVGKDDEVQFHKHADVKNDVD